MVAPDADEPLNPTERAELERLRRELAERQAAPGDPGAAVTPNERRGLRWTAAGLLLILVAVLAFSTVLARFARSEVLDTDRYVATVTPLARNAVLQDELADQITVEIMARGDIANVTKEALTALTQNAPNVPPAVIGLAPVLTSQAQSFIRQAVTALVRSDRFETLWIEANKRAHQRLAAVLTGDTTDGIAIGDDGTVSIELGPIIDNVRNALKDRGFSFADKIPDINKSFVIFRSPDLVKAQKAVSALDKASTVLPFLTLLVGAAAIWAAPRGSRRKAFSLFGIALAVAMALLAVAISIGRSVYLDAVPADVLSPAAAEVLIDTILVPLRTTLRAVAVLAVVIAVVGYLAGTSGSAVAVREAFGRGLNAARGNAEGRVPHPIESAAARYRTPLRIAVVALAIIVLVFWNYPSGLVVMVTVIVAVLALLAIDVIARPAIAYRSHEYSTTKRD
ncbi:hypothetical protein BH683_019975 [Williamsia sp. 1138]|uniref:hypothetical protein n=1 Tax=Williamsia sp. 1138 TaxID=1903117 RepID=UPI000A11F953|nr:hypothetical protein [Williamsia sp. 1138]OZG27196.1 hypothetical protein BH683_019975 [Williamsia sp. 1138]